MHNRFAQVFDDFVSMLDHSSAVKESINRVIMTLKKYGEPALKPAKTPIWRINVSLNAEMIKTHTRNVSVLSELQTKLAGIDNDEEIVNILNAYTPRLSSDVQQLMKQMVDYLRGTYESNRPRNFDPLAPDIKKIPIDMSDILNKKNIKAIFPIPDSDPIQITDDIAKHVAWAFRNIYSVPYPHLRKQKMHGNIARYYHGVEHTTRAAVYVPILINLYRRHELPGAEKISDEDIKYLQIAALFHDAAREDEGVDRWDHESAAMLYLYLVNIGASKEKAKLMAQAIANKDPQADGYYELHEDAAGQLNWIIREKREKNIYENIIHDADCLDIIRARDHFDAEYLDFYKLIKERLYNQIPFEEKAKLICEVRSLIEIQGDGRNRTKTDIKSRYENEDCYQHIVKDIHPARHSLMHSLYGGGKLIKTDELMKMRLVDTQAYDPSKPLTNKNLARAIKNKRIFLRGIGTPSALANKQDETGELTLAGLEEKKMERRPGKPTSSRKKDRTQKHGNPDRSVSLIGYGAGCFANAGYGILNPNIDDIKSVSAIDSDTGYGKKRDRKHLPDLTRKEKEQQLDSVHKRLKMGGSSRTFANVKGAYTHVEINYRITNFDVIIFTQDPCAYNARELSSPHATHEHSPKLQAIFLQNEHKKRFGKTLPIFEYSGLHDFVEEHQFSKQEILTMWVEMCSKYMKDIIKLKELDIFLKSTDEIKMLSMYESIGFAKKNAPADSNYDPAFRAEINAAIEKERQKLRDEYTSQLITAVNADKKTILDDEVFGLVLYQPDLIDKINPDKLTAIREMLKNPKSIFPDNLTEAMSDNFLFPDFVKILQGKELLFKNNPDYKLQFYKLNCFKLYELAKILDTSVVVKIQQDAFEEAMKALNSCREKLKTRKPGLIFCLLNRIKDILNLCCGFDIYPKCRDYINDFILQLIEVEVLRAYNINVERNVTAIQDAYCLIKDCTELGLLDNADIKNKFNIILDLLETDLRAERHTDKPDVIYYYMFISTICGRSKNEQKETLIKYLSSPNTILQRQTNLKCISALFDDRDVFNLILDKIATMGGVDISNNNDIDLLRYYDNLEELKRIMPEKQFSSDQADLLTNKIDVIVNQKLDLISLADLNGQIDFINFIELYLDSIEQLSHEIQINSRLLSSFDQLLLNYSANQPKLPVEIEQKVMRLHAALPMQTERQSLIDRITTMKNTLSL